MRTTPLIIPITTTAPMIPPISIQLTALVVVVGVVVVVVLVVGVVVVVGTDGVVIDPIMAKAEKWAMVAVIVWVIGSTVQGITSQRPEVVL